MLTMRLVSRADHASSHSPAQISVLWLWPSGRTWNGGGWRGLRGRRVRDARRTSRVVQIFTSKSQTWTSRVFVSVGCSLPRHLRLVASQLPNSVTFWQRGCSAGGFVAVVERLAPMRSQKLLLWQWQQQSDPAKCIRLSPVQRNWFWGVS